MGQLQLQFFADYQDIFPDAVVFGPFVERICLTEGSYGEDEYQRNEEVRSP
jgi:hypothetical protein